ncbi:hypothetical protein GH714_024597 [Hevea brasiliensis]|uniref:Eukaryotic translation initiation factor 4B1 n=1 Tax=Hevea brasiliensis TaxID=3981 RepID=A0A6A6M3E8_HEVBR|nr:hypothetical protein GH714_024597 [Hevea brasiliensis]
MSKAWGSNVDWAADVEREEQEAAAEAAAAAAYGESAESQNFPSLKRLTLLSLRRRRCLSTSSTPPPWLRRQYGGFDEERRGPPPRVSDYDQPSRADEIDNWAMMKKSLPSFDSGRQNRYGSLGGGGGGGMGGGSRADEVDNWGSAKKPLPTRSTFGSGFRDSGPESDRWRRGGVREPERERPRLILEPPKADVAANETPKTSRPNPFGAARPREQVLAEKGLDWKKIEVEIEAKKTSSHSSRPASAHSSRPSSAHSARLQTDEEKLLKEEIEQLKEHQKELTVKGNRESQEGPVEDQPNLQDIISQKEKKLEQLIRDWDDKVRFGQKAIERPGSEAGRAASFSERPYSRSGSFDESRSMEYVDRPRSRGSGTQDIWKRPGDDRREGGRERRFLGSRDFDR